MRVTLILVAMFTVYACATGVEQEPRPVDASIEEVQVYIDSVKPEIVAVAGYKDPFGYTYINDKFVLLNGRGGAYLIKFRRLCNDLLSGGMHLDMVDYRERRGQLRAKIDTVRGCLIEEIYKLPDDAQASVESEPATQ